MADTQSFVVVDSIYICLITLELTSIAIKYQGSITNPFKERGSTLLLFLVALFFHAIALKAKTGLPTAIIIHVSGVIACETLLWILVAEFWRCFIINLLLFLAVALSLCDKDTCHLLTNVLGTCFSWIQKTCIKVGQEGLNTDKTTDLEAQEGIELGEHYASREIYGESLPEIAEVVI